MKIKKLEIQSERKSLKERVTTRQFKISALSIIIGAIAGIGIFYFTEGQHLNQVVFMDILKSALIGGFFGFFASNSPCARNRC